jgi:hypothetical protein
MHQPNYIPWAGYFHKLAACDVFVFLDSVQYPRGQTITNRNLVKTANGVTYLTIPVTLPTAVEGKASYREVEYADRRWKRKHLRTLEHAYRRASHFEEIFALIAGQVEPERRFVDLTIGLIDAIASYLEIETPRHRLSELVLEPRHKNELIVDVCEALGATVYLSGTFARVYNDEDELARHGIELRYDEYTTPSYPQLWGSFEPNLSVIDMLFNCGPESRLLVKEPRSSRKMPPCPPPGRRTDETGKTAEDHR